MTLTVHQRVTLQALLPSLKNELTVEMPQGGNALPRLQKHFKFS